MAEASNSFRMQHERAAAQRSSERPDADQPQPEASGSHSFFEHEQEHRTLRGACEDL